MVQTPSKRVGGGKAGHSRRSDVAEVPSVFQKVHPDEHHGRHTGDRVRIGGSGEATRKQQNDAAESSRQSPPIFRLGQQGQLQ